MAPVEPVHRAWHHAFRTHDPLICRQCRVVLRATYFPGEGTETQRVQVTLQGDSTSKEGWPNLNPRLSDSPEDSFPLYPRLILTLRMSAQVRANDTHLPGAVCQ